MNFPELVQAHYFHEAQRRTDLNSSLAIPLGVLTALLAAVGAMLGSLTFPFSPLEWVLLVLGALAALAGLRSAYFVARSYIGFIYKHPTSMKPLGDWRTQIIKDGSSSEEADRKVEELMLEQYTIAADKNAMNNDEKSGLLYSAVLWTVICLAFVLATAVPYLASTITARELKQDIRPFNLFVRQFRENDSERRRFSSSASAASAATPTSASSTNERRTGE